MRTLGLAVVAFGVAGGALLVASRAGATEKAQPSRKPSPTPAPQYAPTKRPQVSPSSTVEPPHYTPPTTSEIPHYDCYADQDVRDTCAAFSSALATGTGSAPMMKIYFDTCMDQQCGDTSTAGHVRTRAILERRARSLAALNRRMQ